MTTITIHGEPQIIAALERLAIDRDRLEKENSDLRDLLRKVQKNLTASDGPFLAMEIDVALAKRDANVAGDKPYHPHALSLIKENYRLQAEVELLTKRLEALTEILRQTLAAWCAGIKHGDMKDLRGDAMALLQQEPSAAARQKVMDEIYYTETAKRDAGEGE